jgi:hypothetical protein
MARSWKRLVIAAAAAAAGAAIYYGWFWRRDVSDDLEQAYVTELTVLTDRKPLPETIRSGEAHPVVVRFRLPLDREQESYIPIFMVVGPDGYDPWGKPDPIEAFPQSSARTAPGARLTVNRGGRVVDVTPKPPAEGDPFHQYCALIDPELFIQNGASSGPLELHLWLYPENKTPSAQKRIGGDGHLIFIHRFQFERTGEK